MGMECHGWLVREMLEMEKCRNQWGGMYVGFPSCVCAGWGEEGMRESCELFSVEERNHRGREGCACMRSTLFYVHGFGLDLRGAIIFYSLYFRRKSPFLVHHDYRSIGPTICLAKRNCYLDHVYFSTL